MPIRDLKDFAPEKEGGRLSFECPECMRKHRVSIRVTDCEKLAKVDPKTWFYWGMLEKITVRPSLVGVDCRLRVRIVNGEIFW